MDLERGKTVVARRPARPAFSAERPSTRRAVVLARGPQGKTGGGGASRYTHVQGTPAATWTINHRLGYRPVVALFDPAGVEMISDVESTTMTTVVTYATPTAGSAELV